MPEDRTHVHYLYIMRFSPESLGIDTPPRLFLQKVQEALTAEGVDISQWAGQPIFATNLFKLGLGYGKACPWNCPYARKVEYKEEDFPMTMRFMDDLAVLRSVQPPNGLELMEC